ncbi:MAG: hypothetical protein RRZ64_07970 [Rikenellaceae bacterium]
MEMLTIIVGALGTLVGTVTSVFYFKRAKRAEVVSAEINTADQMIDLVKKANAEAFELIKIENSKLRKSVSRLEKVLDRVSTCKHFAECPVPKELQCSDDNNNNIA